MSRITVWGFSASSYVRTVRMLLAEKGVSDYEQVPLNVLQGEPKQPEHLARHPFGKVPVVDIDGFRMIETEAIMRYLDAVLPGTSLMPADTKERARMDMIVNVIDSYGYAAIMGGVVGYHLFPDFVGGKDEAKHHEALDRSRHTLNAIAHLRGDGTYLAGDTPSIADLYLAPIAAYVAMTPHRDDLLGLPGIADWWERASALDSFRATAP